MSLPDTRPMAGKQTSTEVTPAAVIGANGPNNLQISGAKIKAINSRHTLESNAIVPSSAATCSPNDGILAG